MSVCLIAKREKALSIHQWDNSPALTFIEGITHKACSVWRAERVSISPECEDVEPGDTRVHLSAAEINTALADRHGGEMDEADGRVISK